MEERLAKTTELEGTAKLTCLLRGKNNNLIYSWLETTYGLFAEGRGEKNLLIYGPDD